MDRIPIQLGNTHSFRESQTADTSLKSTHTNDLQSGQTNAVPDPDVRLQSLDTKINVLSTFHNYYQSKVWALTLSWTVKGPYALLVSGNIWLRRKMHNMRNE